MKKLLLSFSKSFIFPYDLGFTKIGYFSDFRQSDIWFLTSGSVFLTKMHSIKGLACNFVIVFLKVVYTAVSSLVVMSSAGPKIS